MTHLISRMLLDHPLLGEAGGTALYDKMEALYDKIGDSVNSRYFTHDALADSAAIDFVHNFKEAFDELSWVLYLRDTGTGELTLVTATSSPALADFAVVATPGSVTTSFRLTNNSGGPQDVAFLIVQDPMLLDQLLDVNTTAVPPDGSMALVYNSILSQWRPGYSGVHRVIDGAAGNFYPTWGSVIADLLDGETVLQIADTTEVGDVVVTQNFVTLKSLPGKKINFSSVTASNCLKLVGEGVRTEDLWEALSNGNFAKALWVTGLNASVNRHRIDWAGDATGPKVLGKAVHLDTGDIFPGGEAVVRRTAGSPGTVTTALDDSSSASFFNVRGNY